MKRLIAVLLVAPLSVLSTGCPLGCGGYNGNGDVVYARNDDQLILCANGGFSMTTSAGTIEGKVATRVNPLGDDGSPVGIEGDNGATVLTIVGGTVETSEDGSNAWTQVDEDQTDLDHADVSCTDLTTRSWWAPPPLPDTYYSRVPSLCSDADNCLDQLAFCSDGSYALAIGGTFTGGTYDVQGSVVVDFVTDYEFDMTTAVDNLPDGSPWQVTTATTDDNVACAE